MRKLVLDEVDKSRLAELVAEYVMPNEPFTIKNDGEVALNKGGPLRRLFSLKEDESIDFLTAVQTIVEKIMDRKKDNLYVGRLCGDAFGILVTTGERNIVINKLYIAHLLEEDPWATPPSQGSSNNMQQRQVNAKQNRQPIGQQIEIQIAPQPTNLGRQVADICNAFPIIVR